MNSEARGKEIIESIPVNGTVGGYFNICHIPYGMRQNLEKWSLLQSIMRYTGNVTVIRDDCSVKVNLLDIKASIEAHYGAEMYRDFACLMGYFTITSIKGKDEISMSVTRGEEIINSIPANGTVKGFFNIEKLTYDMKKQLNRSNSFAAVLKHERHDVLIHKECNKDYWYLYVELMAHDNVGTGFFEIYSDTETYRDFKALMCYFTITDNNAEKEFKKVPAKGQVTDKPERTVSNMEIYQALQTIKDCCTSCNGCNGCPFLIGNGGCVFSNSLKSPNCWELSEPKEWKPFPALQGGK